MPDLVATLIELSPDATDETATTQNTIATEACSGIAAPLVILDGLLGVGAKPPLREPIRAACRAINQLRTTKGAYVFAVDLPTGLDTDSGKADRDCVVADFTVTIGYAKPGLVADGALNYVGRIELVPLDELRPPETKPKEIIASPAAFRGSLPRRKYSSYKNQFGRVGVVAGSKGFVGAALMASQGALRAGAGLVEVFVPEEIYEIVAGAAFMEAMVKPIASYRHLLKEKADVWAVGPGLGKSCAAEILELVEKIKQPIGTRRRRTEHCFRKKFRAQALQRQTVADAAPWRDETAFPRRATIARQNSDEILCSFSGHTFAQRQSHHRR